MDPADEPRADYIKGERRIVDIFAPGGPIYLQDIREHIQGCLTRELPNNVPYRAKIVLIAAYQSRWCPYAQETFREVHEAFDRTLSHLIQSKFRRYKRLEYRVKSVISELIKL
ncbi:hypothetical protein AcW1_001523 [Taiwanofungus camphoratus]|nr:hypothetical protein AcV7_003629 [Antrodia cinnamomea]KAI0945263.1 hypothetical protein AcW1_001523 [Antrodia cinnamomea]